MKSEPKFRHELKYVISNGQLALLRHRMEGLIPRDIHTGVSGQYNIRSLYFDDYDNRCYYENENGTDLREKFRIRIYNHTHDRIRLECKRKERGKTYKTACSITETQCRQLIRGQYLPDISQQLPVLRKLTLEMMCRRMHPVVIVEYDRIPYVYQNGNVRITFDTNIAAASTLTGFLEDTIVKRPIMPAGQQLLEVKYDEYLPDFIYRALQLDSLQQTAFSKYYLCRKYS
ncbi:MAG: polyphosphate polymerase domain-containing protein [Eubacteriales bacterium]|nr:polyphosphate polymerase domain-containing protein [Eubacteriales bacterium]